MKPRLTRNVGLADKACQGSYETPGIEDHKMIQSRGSRFLSKSSAAYRGGRIPGTLSNNFQQRVTSCPEFSTENKEDLLWHSRCNGRPDL